MTIKARSFGSQLAVLLAFLLVACGNDPARLPVVEDFTNGDSAMAFTTFWDCTGNESGHVGFQVFRDGTGNSYDYGSDTIYWWDWEDTPGSFIAVSGEQNFIVLSASGGKAIRAASFVIDYTPGPTETFTCELVIL